MTNKRRTHLTGKQTKPCIICNIPFKSFICDNRKYCSMKCYHLSPTRGSRPRNRITKTCTFCNKEFERPASNFAKRVKNYFCSHPCSAKWWEINGLHGEDNPMWQGGYSNKTYRDGWEIIKKNVRERANNKCESCNGVHKIMDVHHKIPVRLGIDFKIINRLENLQYLCRPCHIEADKFLRGHYPNTKSKVGL